MEVPQGFKGGSNAEVVPVVDLCRWSRSDWDWLRYMLTSEFMPYHSEVVGKDWSALEPGVQAIVLGLLRIVGGAFIAFGITALWMLVPLKAGVRWSRLALLTITLSLWGPTLYVTLAVRAFAPKAQTPVVPTLVMLTLIGAGLLLSLREGQVSKGFDQSRRLF